MSERKIKLQIKDMTKKYDNGDGVEHINLDIYEGEIVTFLGPSGCGKTTILRTTGGFLDVTSGDITHRRPGHHRPARREAPDRNGIPELQPVAAHDHLRKPRLRPQAPQGAQG